MRAAVTHRLGNRLHAPWLALALLLALAVAAGAAERQAYALDEDPIRLGFKALEAGELAGARGEFLRAIADDYQVHRARFGLAELALREGRYSEAEAFYREAAAARQGTRGAYPEASAGLGLLLLRLGRSAEAESEIARALAGDERLWTANYGRARLLLGQGKPQEAKRHLDQGKGRQGIAGGEDLFHHGMALYHLALEEPEPAEREALLALYLNPGDPEHGELVGRIYEERNEPALAIAAYEKALAASGRAPAPPELHALGRLCQQVGRFNEARDYYLRSAAADSTYAPALKDLAQLLRRADQHEQAARVYLRYVALAPADVAAQLDLADSCYEIGQYAQGVSAARAARDLEPERVEASFALARSGIHAGDPELRREAAALMAALPDTLAWRSRDFIALAAYLDESGRPGEASAALERALARDSENADLHYQLGLAAMKQQRLPEAIAHLAEAATMNPESPVFRINLGIARFQAGDYLGAAPEFERALALNPELSVGRLLLAQAYAVSDSIAAAEAQYRLVLAAEPDNARALRGLGFCHVRQGQYEAAVAAYRRATEIDPQDAEGWAGLGNAHLGRADFAAARAVFQRAQALDPQNATVTRGLELLEQAEHARPADG